MNRHSLFLRMLLLASCQLVDARADTYDLCEALKPEDTDAALKEANKAQIRAQEALDVEESNLALAQQAQEAAVAELTKDSASNAARIAVTQGSKAVQDAARKRKQARNALELATEDATCVQAEHDAARRFVHGLGIAVSGAYAADHTERLGLALRYVHPSEAALTWELAFGVSHFQLSTPDDDRDTLFSLLYRWSFGRDRAAFSLGGGLAWLPKDADEITAARSYAVIGDIGVAFRVNHKCSPTGSSCVTPWVDLRPFAQPWLPFDGSPAAILFGLELGASIGFGRSNSR